ncbi:MAG: sulfatase-like hydrolase/transferase [Hyphomonadaceae bacterium]
MTAKSRTIESTIAGVVALCVLWGCTAASPGVQEQAAAAAPLEQAAQTSDKPPNVIIILADDVGYADISAYGVNRIPTPNIDRIGLDGVRFTDGYVSAPVCGPSRAGLMTGRYQDRFGFEYNNGPARRDVEDNLGLPEDEITIGAALQTVGYHTGVIGKWHLGANDAYYPTNRGYDEFVGFLPGATSYMDPNAPGVHVYQNADRSAAGPPSRNRYTQIIEGPNRTVVHNEDEYLTDYFGRRAADFIGRNAASETPYFLYLAPNAAHDPLMVTQKYYDRFAHIQNEQNRIYAGMVSALDDMVGEVERAVAASGEEDNTLIFFLSDNGCAAYYPGMCACEPLRGGKLTHYEGGARVPMMMRWPAKLKDGQINRQIVSSMDIFPTVLAAAKGSMPTDRTYDGVDLMPMLSGQTDEPAHEMLAWRRSPMASIRMGDWKLWKSLDGKFTLLFNLKDDLNETTNLADEYPEKLKELEAAFDQWAKDMQDPRWPSRPHVTYDVCGTPFEVPI